MAYLKRDWDNTDTKVTKDDFKRMENGIETNDLAVTELGTKKLDAEKVVNTTTALVADKKALNAAQGNPNIDGTLAHQINTLNNARGYLASKSSSTFDLKQNGKYYLKGQFTDCPLPSVTDAAWVLEVSSSTDFGYVVQRTTIIWSDLSGYNDRGKTFTRIYVDGAWGSWQQLATVTQVQAMLDALNA